MSLLLEAGSLNVCKLLSNWVMSVFLIEGANFLLTYLFVVPCFLVSLLACWLVYPSPLWPFLLKQAPPARPLW